MDPRKVLSGRVFGGVSLWRVLGGFPKVNVDCVVGILDRVLDLIDRRPAGRVRDSATGTNTRGMVATAKMTPTRSGSPGGTRMLNSLPRARRAGLHRLRMAVCASVVYIARVYSAAPFEK